jgi:NAD(P)H-nitrite reductase large subunit
MIVCHCERVSDTAVETAIASGAGTVPEVTVRSRAGGRCGSCRVTIETLLAACVRPAADDAAAAA